MKRVDVAAGIRKSYLKYPCDFCDKFCGFSLHQIACSTINSPETIKHQHYLQFLRFVT